MLSGPVAAVDSESNLHAFRIGGAPRAASVGFRNLSPVRVGNVLVAASNVSAVAPGIRSHHGAPPGLRHRRFAPESA
jgi:hypothetical protein